MPTRSGPLTGIKIVEIAGIGPGPFAAMLLSDLGADVLRIDRAQNVSGGDPASPPLDLLNRGRRSVGVDLKQADVLIEGFRPGVMERLGLGPEACFARNPRLVYGRMTGWGQEGPLAGAAGHDINYISLTGALHTIGRHGAAPVPPLNLVGDFGGGTMFLIMGILAALVERASSGKGQVVDAAMTDGSAALMTIFYGLLAMGFWYDERGVNMLDTGAHFYDVYETKDGKYVSIGSIEPQFYQLLLTHTGLAGEALPAQFDRGQWPALKDKVAAIFRSKTRDEWCAIMENTDVCFAPVLGLREAPAHPHNRARGTFTEVAGVVQPAPAPRFSRTPGAIQRPPAHVGQHTDEALADWGFSAAELARLRERNAIR